MESEKMETKTERRTFPEIREEFLKNSGYEVEEKGDVTIVTSKSNYLTGIMVLVMEESGYVLMSINNTVDGKIGVYFRKGPDFGTYLLKKESE